MQRFIIIRVFHAVIALFAISLIIFALIRVSGDPLDTLMDEDATDEDYARVRAYWGLDQPLHMQYAKYIGNIATGN
jgi:peptide/nickel transport system permease protein